MSNKNPISAASVRQDESLSGSRQGQPVDGIFNQCPTSDNVSYVRLWIGFFQGNSHFPGLAADQCLLIAY